MDEKKDNLSPSSTRRGRIGGLPGLGGVFTLILLVGWSWGGVEAGVALARGHPSPIQTLQDIPASSSSDEWSVSELAELLANAEPQERERKLANLLEWMHQLRQQQQHEQEEAAMVAAIESEIASQAILSDGGNARIAMPPPLMHSGSSAVTGGTRVSPPAAHIGTTAEDDGDDEGKGKRGSFMSLCHFKICNMGRKRNLRYNPWTRV